MQTQTTEPVLQFQLPVSEVNFVLDLIGKQPYDQVAGLIDKIRAQAAPQLLSSSPSLSSNRSKRLPPPRLTVSRRPATASSSDPRYMMPIPSGVWVFNLFVRV